MSEYLQQFKIDSEKKAFDRDHRKTINFNITKYDNAVPKGKEQFDDLELAKERAGNIKYRVINGLDKYLTEFEGHFTKRGGKVVWAQNTKEAQKEILRILKNHKIKHVVKSKSMTTEEIELNPFLEKNKILSVETDLGEYIVQVKGEDPYHIVTPAMHLSKSDVAILFNEKFETPIDSTPEYITNWVREKLKEDFAVAGAGITGANFLIADNGSIALTENEGNGLMSMSFPKIHIVVAGIEKIIPSMRDLDLFWPLLSTYGTGQTVTAYNSIVSGPKKNGEIDGPDEMYVILLDNGRTDLLKTKEQRRALSCIRCGACLNACPVYKNIGGHSYAVTYSGPIGAVITPHLEGMKDFNHLSFASSLCGKCTEVCPVKINLHELLLYNRRDAVKKGYQKRSEKFSMTSWKRVMTNRWMLETGSAGFKNFMMGRFFKSAWGPRRTIPKIQDKSFRKLWEERKGKK